MGYGVEDNATPPIVSGDDPASTMFGQPGIYDSPPQQHTEITAKIGQQPSVTPNPSSAFAMANFGTVPKSFDDWIADPANVQKVPTRPIVPGQTGKSFAGMSLATALDSIGSALTGNKPTVGADWNNKVQAGREYDRTLPAVQQQANESAYYGKYLPGESAKSTIAHTNQETQNIGGMLSPAQKLKAQFMSEMQSEAESGKYTPETLAAKMRRTAVYNKIPLTDDEVNTVIGVKPIGAKYTVKTGEKGVFEGLSDKAGNFYAPNQIPNDPEAQALAKSAQGIHSQLVNEETQKESRVAGYAADRAATANQNAIAAADLKKGKELSSKHLEDLRSAQNQNELVQQLASSKSPTDQTSLAFKALGLDLPDGVHRINETELNAIRNQGSLSDRAERALRNWKSGEQFAPEILQDIAKTASTISASKIKNANDNLDDVERVYGYKAPRGAASSSSTGSATHIVYQGGKRIGTATAEQQKKGEYTPD